MESLPFAGLQVEPEDVLRAHALGPYLAIDVVAQSREVELHGVVVVFRRQRVVVDLARLRVEAAERALIHRVEPDLAVAIELDGEQPGRRLVLELPDRVLDELERLRIELADEHLAEIRVPDLAFLIDQYIVRLARRPHHVVLGDDGARVAALGARQRLQFVRPTVDRAQVDGREIVGELPILLGRSRASPVQHGLGLDRLAYGAVAQHAADHLRPLVGIVRRAHDALQRVAADAIEQPRLLLFGTGDAHHPLGVGELAGEILRLLQLDVGRRGFPVHSRLGRGFDVVAHGADAERVFAGFQPVPREAIAAVRVGGDADLDDRFGPAGGDDHALHLAFGFGADDAGERRLTFSADRVDGRWKDHGGGGGGKC